MDKETENIVKLAMKAWKQGEVYHGFGLFTGFKVIDDKTVRCYFVTEGGGTLQDEFTIHPELGVLDHFDHYQESRTHK
jgi:hypothetical protein